MTWMLVVEHFLGEAVLSVKSIEVKILKVECWMLRVKRQGHCYFLDRLRFFSYNFFDVLINALNFGENGAEIV